MVCGSLLQNQFKIHRRPVTENSVAGLFDGAEDHICMRENRCRGSRLKSLQESFPAAAKYML